MADGLPEDRVVARAVDSAWCCEACGDRFTSNRLRMEHDCPAAAADRGDNTARCDLCDHAPHPTSRCAFRWPGGLGCSCADRQTDEERPYSDVPEGYYVREDLGYGEVLVPIDPAARPAVADAVMADLGAAITEGVTEVRLREALRTHHPIMRSETGPFSGCRCGGVKLGEDVIAHVVTELRAALGGEG